MRYRPPVVTKIRSLDFTSVQFPLVISFGGTPVFSKRKTRLGRRACVRSATVQLSRSSSRSRPFARHGGTVSWLSPTIVDHQRRTPPRNHKVRGLTWSRQPLSTHRSSSIPDHHTCTVTKRLGGVENFVIFSTVTTILSAVPGRFSWIVFPWRAIFSTVGIHCDEQQSSIRLWCGSQKQQRIMTPEPTTKFTSCVFFA